MKKSPLTLALALAGTAGAVSAQVPTSTLSIYGLADVGIVQERGNAAGSVTKLTSGVQSGSRLGFRGSEDLGGGNAARFVLESGIGLDTGANNQGGLAFGRQAWVGLGGNWGQFALGRQYTPHYLALLDVDPFKAGLAGDAQNLITSPTRINNAITYRTPEWTGFIGELIYGAGEVVGNPSGGRQFGGAVGYSNGPLVVKLAHHSTNDPTGNDRNKNTLLLGTWNFGVLQGNLGINYQRGFATIDARDYLVGISAPFGPNTILASYIRKDDRSALDRDAHQWAIGYTYALTKRTNFYTAYGRITNKNGAAFTVNSAIEAGSGDQAFNLGVRHVF